MNNSDEKNLLMGILAFQNDFISKEQLVEVTQLWLTNKSQPFEQILIEQKVIGQQRCDLLSALVTEHLQIHEDNPAKSLAALSTIGSVRDELANIADKDVYNTLSIVSMTNDGDEFQTLDSGEYQTNTSDDRPEGKSIKVSGVGESRFRIIKPHAKGGLGEVFLAQDEELSRDVALKEIQSQYADNASSRERFLLEAEVTGGLEHPNIVPVYGLGQYADGRPYYAMRFIKGDSLAEAIKEFHSKKGSLSDSDRQLELRKLLGRFNDVCNAIEYAHARGVLHRDLKPGNIMLGKYGETLVVDWGLAKVAGKSETSASEEEKELTLSFDSNSVETLHGKSIGTPQYMSPEQAVGDLDNLGPASDVYALGATLYCLLTGQAPISKEGGISQVLDRVQKGDFAKPRSIDSTIPKSLEAVCLKAMSIKIEDRYTSPSKITEEIDRFLADEAVDAYKEPLITRAKRWARKHQTAIGTVGALMLTSILFLLLGIYVINEYNEVNKQLAQDEKTARIDEEKQRKIAIQKAEEAENERVKTAQELKRSQALLYANHIVSAQRAWERHEVDLAWHLLDQSQMNQRGWEYAYLHSLFSTPNPIDGHEDSISTVAFSPDGKKIATGSYDLTLKIWDAVTAEEIFTCKGHTGPLMSVAFSSDGKRVVSATGLNGPPEIKIWNVENGREVLSFGGHSKSVTCITFSPDGKQIASASTDKTVKIWDSTTGGEVATLEGHEGTVNSVVFSPDGKHLVTGSYDKTLKVWNADTKQLVRTLKGHTEKVFSVAFSPHGKQIASGSDDKTLKIWDFATGNQILTVGGQNNPITNVLFSPEGQKVTGTQGKLITTWEVATGHEIYTLTGHKDFVYCLDYSQNGKFIVSGSKNNSMKIWDASKGQDPLTFIGHSYFINCVKFSPNGREIASASYDKTLKIWNKKTGQEIHTLAGHTRRVYCLDFSPGGKALVSASGDGTLIIWDVLTGQPISTLKGHSNIVLGVSYSPDGKNIASCSVDQEIKIWDVETEKNILSLQGHSAAINSVAYSPDGKYILSGSDDDTLKLWNAKTGKELLTFKGHSSAVNSVAFSFDGKEIVSSSNDNTIKIWEVESAKEINTLNGHTDQVTHAQFTPNGKNIISCSSDQTIKIWNAKVGVENLTLKGHEASVMYIDISSDGKDIVSSSTDSTLILWKTSEELKNN